jgi:predicted dehydrogenase
MTSGAAPLRVGLVGAGPWAQMFTGRLLAASPAVSLEAVWARRPDAAESLAGKLGTIAASSFDELLATVDAVAFAVAPDAQAQLAPLAAHAGRHLLLEKPLAFDVAGAQRIASAVAAADVASVLLLTYRFSPQVREFVTASNTRALNHTSVSWLAGGALTGSPFATPWRQRADAALLDLGPHAFDLLVSSAGPIVSLRARERHGVVDVATRHESGALGTLTLSVTTPGDAAPLRATAATDEGVVELADPTPGLRSAVPASVAQSLVDAVNGVHDPWVADAAHGLRLQQLIATAQNALQSGAEIDLDPDLA